ncbi:MAG: Uma2 family endonuclease [Chloroflexota bacterium]|nr:Uma2 family endonuclease [Chloroflexota bacterium]
MTTTMVERTKMSMEEFERLIASPEAESRLELIDGEVVEKAMATQEHSWIVQRVGLKIGAYILDNGLGEGGPETRYRKLEDHANSLLPDWSFMLNVTEPVTRGAVPSMPDFALEVQSPDDSMPQMRRKAAIYLSLGARLVWLVLPRQRIVIALWADGDEQLYGVDDSADFRDLLPGFMVAIRDVFPKQR